MIKYGIFIIILTAFCVSCSNTRDRKQVSFSDHQTDANGAIIVDDRALDYNQKQIGTTAESREENAKSGGDSSQIKTMIDGFGNKIETRIFADHPLLHRVIIRTFVGGRKTAFIYGQNGDVNDLPAEMYEKAMNAPADELANAAGIFTGRDPNNLPYFLKATVQTFIADNFLPLPSEPVSKPQTQVSLKNDAPSSDAPVIEKSPVADVNTNTKENFVDYQAEINKLSLTRTAKPSPESEKLPKTQIDLSVSHKVKDK